MKSKFKIFGGFGLVIGLLLFMFIVIPILISKPFDKAENGDLPIGFYIFWLIVGLGFVLYQVLTRLNILELRNEKLLYQNLIIRKKKEINFKEIDGYEHKFEWARGGMYELITLKNDDIDLLKISSFYYSNFTELKKYLQSELKEIKTSHNKV